MRDLQSQQHSARILDPKFISDLEQRGRQALAKSQPDKIGVTKQHHPPSPDRNVKHPAQKIERDFQGRIDENLGLHDRDHAIGERVASKRPDRLGQQRGHAEDLARPDQADQHPLVAVEDGEFRDPRQHDVDAIGCRAFREDGSRPRDAFDLGAPEELLVLFGAHPGERLHAL